ncbi:hypothetical protein BDP27DRAFT_1364722 [Rhodocollybia butyracea]|uniref:Uncharacterized protein n=1 Tax=Rhodocollybia butyracea TaxID=206335 RepID=A0A9P5U669_9AGAR|nr:hypothetical protein BDP27DRAFT_1364722 [Rhodocollybia butyracea]
MAKYLSQPRIGPIWLGKDEKSFLKAKISDTETEIKNLENDNSDLTLNSRKDELRKLKNVLSPIRRVPLDILSEIFILSCSDDAVGDRPNEDTLGRQLLMVPLGFGLFCVFNLVTQEVKIRPGSKGGFLGAEVFLWSYIFNITAAICISHWKKQKR